MVKAWSKPVIWLPESGVPGGSMKPPIFDGSLNPMVAKSHTVLVEPDQLTLEWLKVRQSQNDFFKPSFPQKNE